GDVGGETADQVGAETAGETADAAGKKHVSGVVLPVVLGDERLAARDDLRRFLVRPLDRHDLPGVLALRSNVGALPSRFGLQDRDAAAAEQGKLKMCSQRGAAVDHVDVAERLHRAEPDLAAEED